MKRAGVMVQQRPPYHGDVMVSALEDMGYRVSLGRLQKPGPGDVLVTWNRHRTQDEPIKAHEEAGGTVLVVENGYFGRNFGGSEWYALALDQHNGAGRTPPGDAARWESLGIPLKPWKRDGSEIVILATRGMGSAKCREPSGWAEKVAAALRADQDRPVRIRKHPGPQSQAPETPLEVDLADAWAAVTWGSTAGLKALAMGVPVIHGFPKWIGAGAARFYERGRIERFFGDRQQMFHRVASAMWSIDEIATGKAFRCLLT